MKICETVKIYQILWNSLKIYEILWNSVKFSEILWNFLKFSEILWNSTKFSEIFWKIFWKKSYLEKNTLRRAILFTNSWDAYKSLEPIFYLKNKMDEIFENLNKKKLISP